MPRDNEKKRSDAPGESPPSAPAPDRGAPTPAFHGHTVRFYSDEGALAAALASFVSKGLAAGEGVFALLTPGQRSGLEAALGPDNPGAPSPGTASPADPAGGLVIRDAAEWFGEIAPSGGLPSEESFMASMGGQLGRAGRGRTGLRVVAGIMPALWAQGEQAAALELERLWGRLGSTVAFSLLCPYPTGGFGGAAAVLFRDVCECHGTVQPAEPYSGGATAAERVVQIAELQCRVGALEADEERLRSRALEAVGRLAGGLAHDFNNLLTAINGYGEIALTMVPEEGSLKDALTEIRTAGERAVILTRQLLAFGQRQPLSTVEFDVNEVAADAEHTLQRALGGDIRLEMDLGRRLGRVRTDPGLFRKMLLDLVLNARDAMPGGGALTLATDEAIAIAAAGGRPEPYVRVSVIDTGHGMDAEARDRVFEPFYSTRRAKGSGTVGTGLGLSGVYGTMRQSGGFATMESGAGRGSAVRLHFPRSGPAPSPAARSQKSSLLVVSGERDLGGYLVEILGLEGVPSETVPDAAGALAAAGRNRGVKACLLADRLPEADIERLARGLGRAREDEKDRKAIRVLGLAGPSRNPSDGLGREGEKDIEWIRLPIASADLVRRLREAMAEPIGNAATGSDRFLEGTGS